MQLTKRATVYFDPDIHKILKMKAVETSTSLSELLNKIIRIELIEDQQDLKSFSDRNNEPTVSYEALLQDLQSNGKI